jgi:hypothetical protein
MDAKLQMLEDNGCDIKGSLPRFINDEEFMLSCIEQVLDDEGFEDLGASLEAGETGVAFDCAHSLKGITANTGLVPLYKIVVEIVEPLRAGDPNGLIPVYEKLIFERDKIKDMIK